MPRKEFSAATKRAAWARCQGLCEGQFFFVWRQIVGWKYCHAPIDLGTFHYDHIDPDWFSKNDELENCQVLCHACHKDKTAKDIASIAKSKRVIDKRIKARKPKGRPLPGTRASGLRKRMDGTVERW